MNESNEFMEKCGMQDAARVKCPVESYSRSDSCRTPIGLFEPEVTNGTTVSYTFLDSLPVSKSYRLSNFRASFQY